MKNQSLEELKKSFNELPSDTMESWIDLYFKEKRVASVYKTKRYFDEVFSIEPDQYPYVWWVTSEVVIVFDSWIAEEY